MSNNYKCEVFAHGSKIHEGRACSESLAGMKNIGAHLNFDDEGVTIISYPMQKDNTIASGITLKFTRIIDNE